MTVLYRGDLADTATLVGLAQIQAPIGLIAFTGEASIEMCNYCDHLSRWLMARGLPKISFHPKLSRRDLACVLESPNRDWGWGKRECQTAVRMAGVPLPPGVLV